MMSNEPMSTETESGGIPADSALGIAMEDARQYVADLSIYRIGIVLADTQWQIDFEPKDTQSQGGGLHFTVSATTGEILSRRFEQ